MTTPVSTPISNVRSLPRIPRAVGIASGAIFALVVGSVAGTSASTAQSAPRADLPQLAVDDFDREHPVGWGQATSGAEYLPSARASFSTSDGAGEIAISATGTSRSARLAHDPVSDTEASVTVIAPAVPSSGNGIYTGLQLRGSGTSYYQTTLRFSPDGTVTLAQSRVNESTATQTGLSAHTVVAKDVSAGDRLTLESSTLGDDDEVTIRSRAWTGQEQPDDWTVIATDDSNARLTEPGVTGLWAYLSSASPEGSVATARFDDLFVAGDTGSITDDSNAPGPSPRPETPGTDSGSGSPSTPGPDPTDPGTDADTPKPTPPDTPGGGQTPTPPTGDEESPDGGAPDDEAGHGGSDDAGEPSDDGIPASPGTEPPSTSPISSPSGGGSRAGSDAGSLAVGEAYYKAPDDAVWVDAGASGGNGSRDRPHGSISEAISHARAGQTIVVRGGTYREFVEIRESKPLTVQSAPGEEVWIDGSTELTNWKKSGSTWVSAGWNHRFDSSPTFTKGAPDIDNEHTGFLEKDYPLAAHPEQVWVDGSALRQVGSAAAVTDGTFFADTARKRLIIGSNPDGASVRASERQRGLAVKGAGSSVRGIGVTRFANSVWQMGAVTVEGNGATLENVVISDNATIGLYAWGDDATIRNVTSTRNGMMGMGANKAHGLTVTDSKFTANNLERFTRKPVSGGLKITRTTGVTLSGNDFSDNVTNGVWLDESIYKADVTSNRVVDNGSSGMIVEISEDVTVAGNTVTGNGRYGLWVGSTGDVEVWNNSLGGNSLAALQFTDDKRLNSPETAAKADQDHTEVPWVLGDITVKNNVVSGAGGTCLLCVDDLTKSRSAEQMAISVDSNVYHRFDSGTPRSAIRWTQAAKKPLDFPTIDAFSDNTGNDESSVLAEGAAVLAADSTLASAGEQAADQVTLAGITPALASLLDVPAGTKHAGAW